MDPATPDVHALIEAAQHLNAGKYFQLAAYVVLIFDHILTFSEEVEKIWKRKITGAAILFLINRYGTPLAVIIIIEAYHDPNWTHSVTPFDENVRFIVLTMVGFPRFSGVPAICCLRRRFYDFSDLVMRAGKRQVRVRSGGEKKVSGC
ncbi:hypothetical protein Hypma_013174 [Hypsizygus marmoreus]|uniref:DUF6533 domain-containing protein n=1 Tax=Hypsizygus marmoreus TaxID=39966 RepID=A0A369JLS4_HYPMA|nr:hypothetical protein Hypma_013174 [Hypsizygus marmoreus]